MMLNKEIEEYLEMQEERKIKNNLKAAGIGMVIGIIGGIIIGGR